jgi:hypothetical protein
MEQRDSDLVFNEPRLPHDWAIDTEIAVDRF